MDYKNLIVQWKEFEIPYVLDRDINVNLNVDFITAITGPRRAGKTYFCFQLIKELVKKIPRDNILYINFEDERLIGIEANNLNELLDAFYEMSKIDKNNNIYLFLDEIQNVKNWDMWARRIYDTKKNIRLILTGSSSKLLSREISTKLRGRVINIEVYPLSFKELLKWNNLVYDLNTISYSKNKIEIKKLFNSFLFNGGYPIINIEKKISKDEILQKYYESMIFKDVVERYKIKEIKKLRVLASILFDSATKEISYNKLANKLKSLGFNINKNTVINYISYFEDAYLFFENLRYEYSTIKRLGSIKKIYCIDNGLLNAVSFKFSQDAGKLLENLVFIELKRRKKEVYYHRDNYECDFIVKEKNKVNEIIQVTEELNDENY
ncbi:MAG: ATP-binding protein, partial [Nanoarchaeota archaeon]